MATLDPQSRIDSVVAGKYRIARCIGEGGMGAVYEAEHIVTRRKVAVKLMHPGMGWSADSVERFMREARVAAAIGHKNIIEVLDAGMGADQTPYMVLSLLQGESLGRLLERDGPMPYREALTIVNSVLEALVAAHAAGVVHRDIKPENVFVSTESNGDRSIKLLDFGISKIVSKEEGGIKDRTLTKTGSILGTPDYMSPEQVRGDDDIDERTDVWAVGVMLYRMLTGHLPFEAKNASLVIFHVLSQEPAAVQSLVSDLPEAVAILVTEALVKDRAARTDSAAAMLTAARTILGTPDESLPRARGTQPITRGSNVTASQGPRSVTFIGSAATIESPSDPGPPRDSSRPSIEPGDRVSQTPGPIAATARATGETLPMNRRPWGLIGAIAGVAVLSVAAFVGLRSNGSPSAPAVQPTSTAPASAVTPPPQPAHVDPPVTPPVALQTPPTQTPPVDEPAQQGAHPNVATATQPNTTAQAARPRTGTGSARSGTTTPPRNSGLPGPQSAQSAVIRDINTPPPNPNSQTAPTNTGRSPHVVVDINGM